MYTTYTDEELRRVLATNPQDAEALVEAADRFLAMSSADALLASYDEGFAEGKEAGRYEEGYDEGYEEGHDEGYEEGYDADHGDGLSEGLETAKKPE